MGTLLDGRYWIGPVLARGGMSTVYRGTDTRLERPVAIKVMAPRFAADPVFLQRFEREARAAARLHHPCVVGVHDQGIDSSPTGDYVYLVMELVDGGTLRDLLRQHGRLPVPLALSVAEMVLSALTAAHQEGLVHRDVKPENVLIGAGGVVKVADFGLVRAAAEASNSTGDVILGTVAYLSPEQVATGAADARSDVYATGVLLFEMLTGSPPYTGETALSVAYRHVNDDMPAPNAAGAVVPVALDELIVRATRRDPAARPPDAAAFLQQLQALRADLGIDRVAVPVPSSAGEMSATTITASPAVGPWGTRALARTGAATSEPVTRPASPGSPVLSALESPPRRVHSTTDSYRRERARNRRAFLAWMVVVLILASAVGVGAWWLGSGRWTVVPNLTGLHRGAVSGALASADLQAHLVEDHNDTVPGDVVVRSDPAAGQRAPRGSDITVVISLGHPVVPAVDPGSTVDDAQQAVEQADLQPRTDVNADEFNDTVPAGAVVGLRPAPGTVLTVGAPVTVVVSKGPAPITVPNVRGMRQAEAVAALTRAGLTVQVRRQFDDQTAGGRAIGTDPKAGTGLARGASVTLLISTASVVPDVVGLSVDQARQALADAGLNSTVSQQFGGFGFFGGLGGFANRVVSQSIAPGQAVREGTTVAITTAF
ncbi:MAG: PASTA domain-containing protein [Pseudonocardiales bacterium]|nr:PASTA domain-containing protein [Pseudonocardiales bacterium]MBV9651253.1 PASTA domain-containing protein [Pseudonocardiales bacterium]